MNRFFVTAVLVAFSSSVFAADGQTSKSIDKVKAEAPKILKTTGVTLFGDISFGKPENFGGTFDEGVSYGSAFGYSLNAGYRFIEELEVGLGLGLMNGSVDGANQVKHNAVAQIEVMAKVFPAAKWSIPAYLLVSYSPHERTHFSKNNLMTKGFSDDIEGSTFEGTSLSIGVGYEHRITENLFVFGQFRQRASKYDEFVTKNGSSKIPEQERDTNTFSIGLGAIL